MRRWTARASGPPSRCSMPRCISWRRFRSSTRSTARLHRQMRSSTLDVVPALLGRRGRSPPAERRAITGIDRHPWAVQEARWTFKQLGLHGQARQGDLTRLPPARPRTAIVAAYALNELTEPVRDHLEGYMIHAASVGARSLVIEPIARAVAPSGGNRPPHASSRLADVPTSESFRGAAAPASPLRSRRWSPPSGNQIAITVSARRLSRLTALHRARKNAANTMIRGVSSRAPAQQHAHERSTTCGAWLALRRSGWWCDCDPVDRRAARPRRDVAARPAGR